MHPKQNRPKEYVKTSQQQPRGGENPISKRLAGTGLDLDDLAASAGITPKVLKGYFEGQKPSTSHLYVLDLAFELPQGTLKNEYEKI
jgi:hypothetical protein